MAPNSTIAEFKNLGARRDQPGINRGKRLVVSIEKNVNTGKFASGQVGNLVDVEVRILKDSIE